MEIIRGQTMIESKRSLEDVERYISMVSHELIDPFQEIALYVRAILEDSGEAMAEQSKDDLRAIERICGRSREMVRMFLKYSSLERSALQLGLISVRDVVSSCFASLKKTRDRDGTLEMGELPDVISDIVIFREMIANIISNAVKFAKKDLPLLLRVSAHEADETYDYVFEDNGVGFDMDHAKDIFMPFERAHMPEDFEGSGIGLSIVRTACEMMGGSVGISSSVGGGCTITLMLPKEIVKLPKRQIEIAERKRSEIVIGAICSEEGPYAVISPARRYAYELAVDEINESGGVAGRKLSLLVRDFGSDVERVSAIAWDLVEMEQADVIMGGLLSSAREDIRRVCDERRTPYFFDALYEGGLADRYTFCISAAPEQDLYPMLDHLMRIYGDRIYVVAADYNYGALMAECTRDHVERAGGTVLDAEFFSVQKTDFSDTIENINASDPDVLVSFAVSRDQNELYRLWHERRIRQIPLVSPLGICYSHLHRKWPRPTMSGTYFMSSYCEELQTPAAKRFTNAMRARWSEREIPYIEADAETAYTSVYLYKAAVEMAGTTDSERVIDALESGRISFLGPGGEVTVRGEDHHTIREQRLFFVDDDHRVSMVKSFTGLYPDFVERAIEHDTGRSGGLRALGADAPNVQYNMMYRRIR